MNSMENLFSGKTKFKELAGDPTISRLSSLQSYLHMLKNNSEITQAEYKQCDHKMLALPKQLVYQRYISNLIIYCTG